MKRLMSGDLYSWSVFSEARQLDFNGHLWTRPEGNVLIDPVPMSDSDQAQLDGLGGAAFIILTNCDHERDADAFRKRTGAKVAIHADDAGELSSPPDVRLHDGDEIVAGLRAVSLRHGKSPGEIALYFRERDIVLFGDLVVGSPMGELSLLSDEKLDDPPNAALELRKLLRRPFGTVLVGDGHSIFHDGRRRLVECLERRRDIYINKIHLDDIEWWKRNTPAPYAFEDKDIDPLIGAEKLGYRLIRLQPGVASFPMHFHHVGEEMSLVLEGSCTLKTPRGDWKVREGDVIAFPIGEAGTHKFVNEGDAACVLLVVGTVERSDVSEYPDSKKVYPYVAGKIFKAESAVGYWDGEVK